VAILSVKRSRGGESCDDQSETHIYLVETDTATTTCREAREADDGVTAVPAYWEALGGGSDWVVTSKRASLIDEKSPFYFRVEVVYSAPAFGGTPEPGEKWNVRVSVTGAEYVAPTSIDRNGDQITNSVGDLFNPPAMKQGFDEIITVSWQSDEVDIEDLSAARGKVNSDAFSITVRNWTKSFTEDQVKVGNITYDTVLGVDGEEYWNVSVPLLYRSDEWITKLEDKGYRKKLDDDSLSEYLDTEVYLASDGTQLPDSTAVHTIDVYLDEQVAVAPLFAGLT
jgi:hypothetical protein